MKVIGIDYDDTYSALPELFELFMREAKKCGHIPVIVTFRDPKDVIDGLEWEIFYTNGKQKAEYMREAGLEVDIWVDDMPELIGNTIWFDQAVGDK